MTYARPRRRTTCASHCMRTLSENVLAFWRMNTYSRYAIPANMGKWSLIGGRIENGERDPEAALRRELSEELSAPPLDIRPLHVYPQNERLHHVFTVQLDLSGGPLRADPAEVVETELTSLHEGNFARYQIRPSEFAAWRKVWDAA